MVLKHLKKHAFLLQQSQYNISRYVLYTMGTSLTENTQEESASTVRVSMDNNSPEPARRRLKKEAIHANDLPDSMRNTFHNSVVPYLHEYAGMIAPWQNPKEEDIQGIWAYCSMKEDAHLDDRTYFILAKLVFRFCRASVVY
jgi:hypothetical protein